MPGWERLYNVGGPHQLFGIVTAEYLFGLFYSDLFDSLASMEMEQPVAFQVLLDCIEQLKGAGLYYGNQTCLRSTFCGLDLGVKELGNMCVA